MSLGTRLSAIFAFVFASLLACPDAAAAQLRANIEILGPTVRLSDVFDGVPAAVDCEIARSPQPGKSITYDANVIALLIQKYKLDVPSHNYADHVTITTKSIKITGEDIKGVVITKLKDLDVKGDIDVIFDNHALELALPADRPADFSLNNFTYDAVNKRFRADLVAENFGGPQSQTVSGRISVRRTVPVLVRKLEAGTVLSSADIEFISVAEERIAGAALSAEEIVGRELRQDIEAERPVPLHDLIPPRFVIRGTLVTIKIETPMMQVAAQGRALQDGKMGETVRVTNTQSNRMVEGVVEGPGVVRIEAPRKLASTDLTAKQE